MIKSVTPGRIRARTDHPLPPAAIEAMRGELAAIAPSVSLTANARARSLLVLFPEEPDVAGRLAERIEALLRDCAASQAAAATPGREQCRLAARKKAGKAELIGMNTVKKGMVLSLGGALALLAARRDSAHGLAGGAFLALLARHLWVYRKRVWM